jgi:hypothetical protein
MAVTDVLNRAQAWLDEADKRGINMTDEYGYLAVIRDLTVEVRRLGALVPSNAIAWQERVVEVQQALRAYRVLRVAVDAMMAPLGYHGSIAARDDRVQSVMDALAQIDEIENEGNPIKWSVILESLRDKDKGGPV